MAIRYFAFHDNDVKLKNRGAFEIREDEQKFYNEQGYGIFMTFNSFAGERRKKENVTEICFWACDIDEGSKEEQLQRINALMIKPNIVVESKNGFHCYWKAKNATKENYETIEKGIIKKLNGDKHCKDPLRLLRVPFMYHNKDKDSPYLVTIKKAEKRSFEESQMLYYFGEKEEKKKEYTTRDLKDCELKDYEIIFKIKNIGKGERNSYLYWVLNRLKDSNLSNNEVRQIIEHLNHCLVDSLDELEVKQLLRGSKII